MNFNENYVVSHEIPSVIEYCNIRKLCNLAPKTHEAAKIGLPRSLFAVTIREKLSGKLIGLGRVIGDLGCFVQITDIAVLPEFQGNGISHIIMNNIMEFININVPKCAFVNLFADVEFLYQKYGFILSENSKGMYLKR